MHWGCKPPLDEGPTHFPQSTLETGGPGSPSGFCPLWEAPNLTVTLSRTIIADMQRAWDMCSTCPHNPSLQTNTYTAYKSRSYFFSLPRIPLLLCVLLFLAAHSPSLSCLCPFCMCELRSPRARGQPYSFLFFFYLFPNPITQPGWDCPSVNRKGILREIVVGNNKPTCHEDKSIFKASGFSGTTAQKSITSCSFWSCYCIWLSYPSA